MKKRKPLFSTRPIRPTDAGGLAALEHRCLPERPLWGRKAYWARMARETGEVFCLLAEAGEGEAPAGVIGCECRGREAGILFLLVAPDARRQGIGRALLEQALAQAVRRGAEAATLEVRAGNTAALSLYESEGFFRSGELPGYYEDGETALVLWRTGLGRT